MAVGEIPLPMFPVVPGVRLAAVAAGIKYADRTDLLLCEFGESTRCAAVFTRNRFCAAPVAVARAHLACQPRWLIVNSGNANAGTGARGYDDARRICAGVAELVGGQVEQVLPFSTGVIGEYLPVEKILTALPAAYRALRPDAWEAGSRAIMTTDTCPKGVSIAWQADGYAFVLNGFAKGAGMIHPNMATMLAFLATDAAVAPVALRQALDDAVADSFNAITVDGDTSTNDACFLAATGSAGNPEIDRASPAYLALSQAVRSACRQLAELIVRDGEGATKLLRIVVDGAHDARDARIVADTVAHSPLVKTAFFASDPNWGRILAAVGRADIKRLDVAGVSIQLGEVLIVKDGQRAATYTEAQGQMAMAATDITVRINLGMGGASAEVWTCDLSYDYVRINADYRT